MLKHPPHILVPPPQHPNNLRKHRIMLFLCGLLPQYQIHDPGGVKGYVGTDVLYNGFYFQGLLELVHWDGGGGEGVGGVGRAFGG